VASNLAIALAGQHSDILLVDTDSRSPALHRIFNMPNRWGLRDLLQESQPVLYLPASALARRTPLQGLMLLPHGTGPREGAESLVSDRFPELILRCRRLFHTVVIDAAPLLQSPETTWLARLADGVILVVRADQTRQQEAIRAAQMLRADGVRVIGTILNDWDSRSNGEADPARCRFQPGE
jgi:Mrp family chromosome partitioning ATPase